VENHKPSARLPRGPAGGHLPIGSLAESGYHREQEDRVDALGSQDHLRSLSIADQAG